MRIRALFGASLLGILFLGMGMPHHVRAESAALSALRVTTTGNGAITLAPGEVKSISLSFQNTGTATWKNDGAGYISLYTHGPKYRTSVFDPGTWLSPTQVKRIREASVAPKGTATILFDLRAPSTPGVYTETFALASESVAWIDGGTFSLTITVAEPEQDDSLVRTDNYPSLEEGDTYTGEIVAQTATKIKAKAGKPISFTLAVKNTGNATWNTIQLADASAVTAARTGTRISFAHSSWNGSSAATLHDARIAPGQIATLQFFMLAPQVNGVHTVAFSLTANDESVDGGSFMLPIEVTGGSGELADAPAVAEENIVLGEEPTMRVGVLIVDEETDWEVRIGSSQSDLTLTDTAGKTLATVAKGDDILAFYSEGIYVYGEGASQGRSSLPLRFVPNTANAVLEVTNFDRRVTRGTSYANNTFRNVLELRYNTSKDRTWLINELPMEYYLRGLAETSDSSPEEFQKALLTAARTYAYYHYTHTNKHAAEGYLVDAYRDQVYWGYGQEERTPNITAGVEATRGQIVTYQGETAITSYFSRSDGRTRNWSEVWARDIPYARSVPVPCDVGKTLWGHGVGMSASGALCMARDGQKWDEILKYFYTGVDIEQKWR